jgi:hypothetical protein
MRCNNCHCPLRNNDGGGECCVCGEPLCEKCACNECDRCGKPCCEGCSQVDGQAIMRCKPCHENQPVPLNPDIVAAFAALKAGEP